MSPLFQLQTSIRDAARKIFAAARETQDVAEHSRAEEQLLRQAAILDGVDRILREALSCETNEQIARVCLAVAGELTGSKLGLIGEVSGEGGVDIIAASNPGRAAPPLAHAGAAKALRGVEPCGYWGRVLKSGETQVVNDPASDPDRIGIADYDPPVTAFLGVPLKQGDQTVGFIGLANKATAYDACDQQAVETLSAVVVQALTRKRVENALRTSEANFRGLVEHVPIGVYQSRPNGRILLANTALVRMLGYESQAELLNADIGQDLYAVPARRQELTRKLEQEGELRNVELVLRRKDGRLITVLENCRVVKEGFGEEWYYEGTLADITERKQAEEALQESERRFRDLLETVRLAAVMLDIEGRITFANKHLLELTGWAPSEVEGGDWFDLFIPEEEREGMKRVFYSATVESRIAFHHQNPILTRDGRRRLIEWDNTVLRDPQGRIVGTASLGRDVTEQKELEERFRQAQKLESVGRLAGGVAHDFNNLLTVINGYSELLAGELPAGDPMRASAEEILRAGQRAAGLTRQLLTFSRKQVTRPKVLNLNEVITEVAAMLKRLLGEDIKLVTALDPAAEKVTADPVQVHQVLLNLVANARDAMPQGGKLAITTANVFLDAHRTALHPGVAPGRFVELTVTDTGVGMEEETKNHLFEPFFTTKEAGKGTGLGLSTVYGIVKQSQGDIQVHSQLGKGTTVRIYLPSVVEAPVLDRPLTAEPAHLRGTETILLVEDEPGVRALAADILRRKGYEVLEAENGRHALLICESCPGMIHLTVSDVVMPEMGGRELAERLSLLQPAMQVLYMSGYAEHGAAALPGPEPSLNFLQKPFTPDALCRKVREILDKPRSCSSESGPDSPGRG